MRILTVLLALSIFAMAGPPEPGSRSRNVKFSIRDGDSFRDTSLNKHKGRIVILMMMTPWCPICQSHAKSVGDGLLDRFNSGAKKKRGKNKNGVPIESILLATEEAPQWDSLSISFAPTNGFMTWGLDARADRSEPRTLLGYFRGGFIKSNNLYDWGNDRRRLVVINMVQGSSSHLYREIILNTNSFTSADAAGARALINEVKAAKRKQR